MYILNWSTDFHLSNSIHFSSLKHLKLFCLTLKNILSIIHTRTNAHTQTHTHTYVLICKSTSESYILIYM